MEGLSKQYRPAQTQRTTQSIIRSYNHQRNFLVRPRTHIVHNNIIITNCDEIARANEKDFKFKIVLHVVTK